MLTMVQCFSTEPIIVEKAVAEEFTRYLKEEVDNHYSGSVGSAVNKAGAEHAHAIIQKAVNGGAQLVAGDNSFIGNTGASIKPTIIRESILRTTFLTKRLSDRQCSPWIVGLLFFFLHS